MKCFHVEHVAYDWGKANTGEAVVRRALQRISFATFPIPIRFEVLDAHAPGLSILRVEALVPDARWNPSTAVNQVMVDGVIYPGTRIERPMLPVSLHEQVHAGMERMSDEDIGKWLRSLVMRLLAHEVDEHLKIDGRFLTDPHPEQSIVFKMHANIAP